MAFAPPLEEDARMDRPEREGRDFGSAEEEEEVWREEDEEEDGVEDDLASGREEERTERPLISMAGAEGGEGVSFGGGGVGMEFGKDEEEDEGANSQTDNQRMGPNG